MQNTKRYVGLAIVALVAMGFGACGSSDSKETKKTGRSATGSCTAESTEGGNVTCTGQDEYDACLLAACNNEYKTCLGADYLSGNYTGTCKTETACILACACDDLSCEMNCYNNASADCESCINVMMDCETNSNCTEPVCSGGGGGGSGGGDGQGGDGQGGETSTNQGGTSTNTGGTSTNTGGTSATDTTGTSTIGHCPYTTDSFDCNSACSNLKAIANKCQSDPSLAEEIQAVLTLASSGSANACKAGCAAASPTAMPQWQCYQAVPVSTDCTAIAGCTYGNCPP
jgi:hypothetical protein